VSTSAQLRTAVKDALVAAGVGAYRAAGGYTSSDTGPIFYSRMPATPDRVIVITTYPVGLPYLTGVQVRCRGAAGSTVSAEDLADAVRPVLHGREDLPGIEAITYQSGARMGFDAQGRDEVSLNFHAMTDDPASAVAHD